MEPLWSPVVATDGNWSRIAAFLLGSICMIPNMHRVLSRLWSSEDLYCRASSVREGPGQVPT
jgi:hypothetical protein